MEYIIVFVVVMALLGLIAEYWYIVLIVFIGYIIWKKSEINEKDSGFSSNYIPLSVRNTLIQIASKYSEKDKTKLFRELKKCTKISTKEAKNAVEVYFSDKERFISDTKYAQTENLIGDHGFLTNPTIQYNKLYPNNIENKKEFTEIYKNEENSFDNMEGHDFEKFCARLLKKNGFKDVEVTKGSGDFGVDILANKDGISYAIQCKCYSSNIGNKAIQEAHSGKEYYHCMVGVVLTNRYFTKAAKELAEKHNILLWDRDKLLSLVGKNKNLQEDKEEDKEGISIDFENKTLSEDKKEQEIPVKEDVLNNEGGKEMYDKEKGIYPAGVYVVGEDIEMGKYLLVGKKGKDPMVTFYENYSKYRKEEINQMERFEDEYYLSLRENGMVIAIRDADIKRL